MASAINPIDQSHIKLQKDTYFRQDMGNIEALAKDIAENGLREPILVRPSQSGKSFVVIDGWRRVLAARQANTKGAKIKHLPANFADESTTLKDDIIMMLNASNSPGGLSLKPTEEGRAIAYLQDNFDMSAREIGKLINMTTPTVIDRKGLLKGSRRLKEAVDYENYPVTIAKRIIAAYPNDHKTQDELINKTTLKGNDESTARKERKALDHELSGLAQTYERPLKELNSLLKKCKVKAGSIDDVIIAAKDSKCPKALDLAIAAATVKGLMLALGSKMPNPFQKG